MKLAIAMLLAYLPFMWWMYKQAIEDFDETKTVSDLSWYENPDRSGGQFTDEEIDRSRRGGEGW